MKLVLGNHENYWDIFDVLDKIQEKSSEADLHVPPEGCRKSPERNYTRKASIICNVDGNKERLHFYIQGPQQ